MSTDAKRMIVIQQGNIYHNCQVESKKNRATSGTDGDVHRL